MGDDMKMSERQSGLLVPAADPPPPPEHPVLPVIRRALRLLSNELREYAQTTHGTGLTDPHDIGSVAGALVYCYREPSAYSISTLSQLIDGLKK